MSFFRQHGSVNTGGDFPVADAGVYTCLLKEIETVKQPKFDSPDEMVDKFRWVFVTRDDVDENGQPYRFVRFTGTSFGFDRANLTIHMDQMMGRRLKDAEFFALDIEELKQRPWSVSVDRSYNQKGKEINKIDWVRPVRQQQAAPKPANTFGDMAKANRPAPKPPVRSEDEADFEDPFAE